MTEIYFAGCESEELAGVIMDINGNQLVSFYHMPTKLKTLGTIKEMRNLKKKLFIDSGAFSAFTLGGKIDLDEYIDFCKRTDADYYAVYDSIGNAEETLKNQKYMESKGIKPIPCFHYGEDWKYLEYYCKNYDYIALGGMVGNRTMIKGWLDVIFSKYPDKRFHGFGLTTISLIKGYSWHSVDSSSWLMGGRSGTLWSFKYGSCYYKELDKESEKSTLFLKEIAAYGFNKEEMLSSHVARNKFNALQYFKINEIIEEKQTTKQFQLKDFKFGQQSISKTDYKEWLLQNYKELPDEEVAISLISHHFEIPKEQVRLDKW